MTSEICYGWDAFNKKIYRFISLYQRELWIDMGNPEFPEDRQKVDASHILVRRVVKWEPNEMGFEEGHHE